MKSILYIILYLVLVLTTIGSFSCKPKPTSETTSDTAVTTDTTATAVTPSTPPPTSMGNQKTHATAHGIVTRANQMIITNATSNDYFLNSGGYVLAAANVGADASSIKKVFCFAYRENDATGRKLIKTITAQLDSMLQTDSLNTKCYANSKETFYDIFSKTDATGMNQQGLAVYVNELIKYGYCDCLKDFHTGSGFFSALTIDNTGKAVGQIGGF